MFPTFRKKSTALKMKLIVSLLIENTKTEKKFN